MALEPGQLATSNDVPTSITDAFSVPSGKNYQAQALFVANRSGSARNISLYLTTSADVVLFQWTENIPAGDANTNNLRPYVIGFPVGSTQKIRWHANGASLAAIISGIKN